MTFERVLSDHWLELLLLWMASSVLYRRHAAKPLMAAIHPDTVFSEKWASSRIGTGLLARLGTARNCMHVQVTSTELKIHPHFPFTLGFMPEIYDLDHAIPLQKVRSATILSGARAKAVEVRYIHRDGADGTALLLLKNAEAFVSEVLAHKTQAPRTAADA